MVFSKQLFDSLGIANVRKDTRKEGYQASPQTWGFIGTQSMGQVSAECTAHAAVAQSAFTWAENKYVGAGAQGTAQVLPLGVSSLLCPISLLPRKHCN